MSTIPGHKYYGGATVMRLSDANGVPYMSCCTRKLADNVFGFRIFKGANLEEVPLTPFCTGKGSMNLAGWWVAASDNDTWFGGKIPGFAPHPTIGSDARVGELVKAMAALHARIDALETALANSAAPIALDPHDRTALDKLRTLLGL